MFVFMAEFSEPVLVVRRTKNNTTIVKRHRGARRNVVIPNYKFRRDFKPTDYHPAVLAELWLAGPIKLTEQVRKELKMQVAIHRNKIVAKIQDGEETPEFHEDAKVYSREDLEGKSMKELIKIYNAMFSKKDRVKVLDGVEGDIIAAQNMIWDALEAYEIQEKPASTPRTKNSYEFVAEVAEDAKMPPQAIAIVAELQAAGKPLTREELISACEGKINTKQPVGRIVAFYQKRLVDEGYITVG